MSFVESPVVVEGCKGDAGRLEGPVGRDDGPRQEGCVAGAKGEVMRGKDLPGFRTLDPTPRCQGHIAPTRKDVGIVELGLSVTHQHQTMNIVRNNTQPSDGIRT